MAEVSDRLDLAVGSVIRHGEFPCVAILSREQLTTLPSSPSMTLRYRKC
jgi:hypothetical protein